MWINRLRMKALAWVIAIGLAAIGAISIFAIPTLAALSVAVAVAAVAINQLGHRLTLSQPTCFGCGGDLTGRKPGTYGVVCSECGTVNQVSTFQDAGTQVAAEQDDAAADETRSA